MATKDTMKIQDTFLNQARKENVLVTIHLVNGFQLKGMVRGFDQFTIVIDAMGKQQMIYKHAVSTISPAKNLNLKAGAGEEAPAAAAE